MELKINVPSTLNEIPLKHYQEFLKVQEGSTDEEFIAQKMIEIFCGISLSDVVNIKLKSLNELIVHFTKLFEQKPSFQQTFKIENVEFGFIPELEEISFGEYVDLESHLTSWDNYHKAMAVMYRPITKKDKKNRYDIREYKPNPDMQELMKFAPLDVCLASTVFFYNLENDLLLATLSYLEKQITTNKEVSTILAKQLNSPNDGDGIKVFMDSLKETSRSLTRLPSIDLLNVLPISRSRNKKTKLNKDTLTNK
jgi:hypothetical protein